MGEEKRHQLMQNLFGDQYSPFDCSDTMQALRAEPMLETISPQVALALRGLMGLETADENPRLEGATWVLGVDDDWGAGQWVASPLSSTIRSGSSPGAQSRVRSVHHQ
ncbi:hypothetical protein C1H46_016208 [Malus baccata]|uniref:Uncharacterized protein n=1 Tax=Malus baccata TaxID=106549 RepID=A0A540MHG1_MALBA|nr:hypothetical protein C1H46_016208 [Malus baccata]